MCALNEGWVGNSISPYKLCRSEYSQYSLHVLWGYVSGNRVNWSSVFMRFAFSVAKISGFDGAGMVVSLGFIFVVIFYRPGWPGNTKRMISMTDMGHAGFRPVLLSCPE